MALGLRTNGNDNHVAMQGTDETLAFPGSVSVPSAAGQDFSAISLEGKDSTASHLAQVAAAVLNDQPQRGLLTESGFAGVIGGRAGEVFGTNGFEDITVFDLPGTILFDASFNRGGDVVRLGGDAVNWSVALTGSSAVFSDGDTSVFVPIGTEGMAVVFDDGARTLRYDEASGEALIGTQEIAGVAEVIAAAASPGAVPDNADPGAAAQLLMVSGGGAVAGGNLRVFGTTLGHESFYFLQGQIEMDPSFNRGGDGIIVNGWTTDFTATLNGSNVLLDGPMIDLSVPVGVAGTSLHFRNGERILRYDIEHDTVFVEIPQIAVAVHLNNFV